MRSDFSDAQVQVGGAAEVVEQGVDDDAHARRQVSAVRVVHDDLALARVVNAGQQQLQRARAQVGRDALAAIGGGANIPATILSTANSFAANVGTIVDQLQAAGAQHIIVWDAPNVGLAPAVVASGAADLATFLTASMNVALAARLAGEPGVMTFDLFGLGTQIALHPALFGFTNVTDACGAIVAANCDQYAYWDGIHPTAAAHRAIADAFAVVAVPEPETWVLLAGGLAALGWVARRRTRATTAA